MSTSTFVPDARTPPPHCLIASDRVEGTTVFRSDGKRIGVIERLMIEKVSGKVAYAVLTFGGVLWRGKKHLPVPWGRLEYSVVHEGYFAHLTEEELTRAPCFDAGSDFDWGNRAEEQRLHRFYRSTPSWS
jgi:hypothetical protein